jgi:protein-S-isoprenylcysteine O-methyltransferase Ste14
MTAAALLIVLAAWLTMLVVLAIRHRRLSGAAATRRTSSRLGLLLQALGYAGVFGVRPAGLAGPAAWAGSPDAMAAAAAVMTVVGALVVVWSQDALGVQWSLTARLVAQHRLITSGPYAYVRHPIYSAMILMLVGTGIVRTTPLVTGAALALYVIGTLVRIRAEEALMEEAFGVDWDRYRRRVPALVPFIRRGR